MTTLDNPLNAPDPSTVSPMPVSTRYGGIIAAILIIFGLVLHVTGISDPTSQSAASQALGCVNYIIMIAGIVMAIKFHRDNELGGFLKLGRGIGVGTLTGLVIGVISAVWMIIFMKFIAPDMSEAIMDAALENAQPGQEEMTEKMAGYFTNPFMLAGFSLLGSVVIGFLTGLIGGAIMKKEPPAHL
jgi:hypothetical protein